MLSDQVPTHIERHRIALTDETHGAPGARTAYRLQACLGGTAAIECAVDTGTVCQRLERRDRILGERIQHHVRLQRLGC